VILEEEKLDTYSFVDLDTSVRFPSYLVLMFGGTSFLAATHLHYFYKSRTLGQRCKLFTNLYSLKPNNRESHLLTTQFSKSLLKKYKLPQTKIKHILQTHLNVLLNWPLEHLKSKPFHMDFQFLVNQTRNHPSQQIISTCKYLKTIRNMFNSKTNTTKLIASCNISTNTLFVKSNPIPKENKFQTRQNHMKHYQEKQSNQRNQFHIKKCTSQAKPQFWI